MRIHRNKNWLFLYPTCYLHTLNQFSSITKYCNKCSTCNILQIRPFMSSPRVFSNFPQMRKNWRQVRSSSNESHPLRFSFLFFFARFTEKGRDWQDIKSKRDGWLNQSPWRGSSTFHRGQTEISRVTTWRAVPSPPTINPIRLFLSYPWRLKFPQETLSIIKLPRPSRRRWLLFAS